MKLTTGASKLITCLPVPTTPSRITVDNRPGAFGADIHETAVEDVHVALAHTFVPNESDAVGVELDVPKLKPEIDTTPRPLTQPFVCVLLTTGAV